jgi:hypothetical protein
MNDSATVLTVRGVSRAARERLKRQAAREKCSVNALVVRLIESGGAAPHAPKSPTYGDLDHLAGTWKTADAKAFERAGAPFAEVDPALWK